MKGRKRGEEVEGPPADGRESYNDNEVSRRGAEQKLLSEELTCKIPDVMERNTQDAEGEGTVKGKPEYSLPRVLK